MGVGFGGKRIPVAISLALQQPVEQSLQEIREVRPVGAQQGHQGWHARSHGFLDVSRGGPQHIHQGLQDPLDLQSNGSSQLSEIEILDAHCSKAGLQRGKIFRYNSPFSHLFSALC